jgi:hypothetical protein
MSKVVGLPNNSYKPITKRACVRPGFVNYNNGCTKLAAASDKFTSCLLIVGSSLWVLRLLPPLKLVAMILLKVELNAKNQSIKKFELHRWHNG